MALRKVGLLGIISIGFALLVVGSLTKFAIVGCKRNGAGLTGNSAANAPLETPLAVVEAKDIDLRVNRLLNSELGLLVAMNNSNIGRFFSLSFQEIYAFKPVVSG